MRIHITQKGSKLIHLRFPTGLVMNRLSVWSLLRFLRSKGVAISYRQGCKFLKVLNTYRKRHRDWTLVEVHSQDGEYVQIRL